MFLKKKVITITLILGVLLTFVAIVNRISPKKLPESMVLPTITSINTPVPGIRKSNAIPATPQERISPRDTLPQNILTSLISELPYETDNFLIEYYPYDRIVMVSMKRPGEDNIKKAANWLIEQGVTNPTQNNRIIFSYWKNAE